MQCDRHTIDIRDLKGDRAAKTGVDKARRGVDDDPQPAERTSPLDARDNIIRQADFFERDAEHEFTGLNDERFPLLHFDQAGDAFFTVHFGGIKHGNLTVFVHLKIFPEPHVDRAGTNLIFPIGVWGVDMDLAGFNFGEDVAVGKNHEQNKVVKAF